MRECVLVVGGALCVCVCECMCMPVWGNAHANAHLCTWRYFCNHLSDLKGDVAMPFWAVGCPILEALNNTGDKSFKVSQSDISWLPERKKQEETLSSHHQTLHLARPEIQKTCHFWKSGECDVSLMQGFFLFVSIPLCVCPLCWLTARNGTLCLWRQNTSFVCLVIHGVFCLRYPWTALTHWGFH